MEVDVNEVDGAQIAALNGILDETSHDVFETWLHPLITERGTRLIVDLAGVPRVTSAGLSLLVTLVARANTKGSNVVLAAPTPFVESVIGVTRLDQFFAMAPTVEQAIQHKDSE
jgi:anti-sigma B factor antagonist